MPPHSAQLVAIVTGASSGIGLALTCHLLTKGYRVYMADLAPPNEQAIRQLRAATSSTLKFNSQQQQQQSTDYNNHSEGNTTPSSTSSSSLPLPYNSTTSPMHSPPPSPSLLTSTASYTFFRVNVVSFAEQASLFKLAYSYNGNIDFFAANAGIDDREDVFREFSLDEEPKAPNFTTVDVNLNAILAGLKLFIHYSRKSRRGREKYKSLTNGNGHGHGHGHGGENGVVNGNGYLPPPRMKKMVVTSSMAGIYAFPSNPVYCATKHALVGLVRAAGDRLLQDPTTNITLNAILPSFVATNLAPAGLIDTIRKAGHLSPMSSLMQGYDRILEDDNLTAQTIEVSGEDLFFREQMPYATPSQRFLVEDPEGLWTGAYGRKRKGDEGTEEVEMTG